MLGVLSLFNEADKLRNISKINQQIGAEAQVMQCSKKYAAEFESLEQLKQHKALCQDTHIERPLHKVGIV